jgi:hypothetical protein
MIMDDRKQIKELADMSTNKKERAKAVKKTIEKEQPLRPKTLKNLLQDWKDDLKKLGQTAVWPSWLHGQYIKESNLETQSNVTRRAARVYPDVKTKIVRQHNKNVVITYNRKTGAIIPTPGMSTANANALNQRNERVAKQREYYKDDNHLAAVTAMLRMPRNMRRTLCRKLNLKWGLDGYCEAEAMIFEDLRIARLEG